MSVSGRRDAGGRTGVRHATADAPEVQAAADA
jgi:hypothetical protein